MFTRFASIFFLVVWHIRSIIPTLLAFIVTGAAAVTLFEKMPFADSLYFAFVTGLTIGYGDIVMNTHIGRVIALLIGFIGILFTGLTVAIMVYAVRETMAKSKYHRPH